MSYLKKTIEGISWIGLLRLSTRGIGFIKFAFLARILSPEEFGIYGIAALVLAFLEIFTETGINVFFIQKEGSLKDYLNTAWTASIVRGAIISALILVAASPISDFFNTPEVFHLLTLLCLVPLIKGFINPALISLQMEMSFKKEFWLRFFIFLIDASSAVVIGLITLDASSLVWGLVIGAVFELVLSFVWISPRPSLSFDKVKFTHVVNRGKWLAWSGIFEYLFRNGDDIVVGKMLGSGSLGIYQMAYKLAILPISEVADVVGKVTLPIFVTLSAEKLRLRRAFIYTTITIFTLLLPIVLLLLVLPELIIKVAFGEQWVNSAEILKILVFYSFIRALINPMLTVFIAVKKQEYVTVISFIGVIVSFISLFVLLPRYGLNGVGISTIVSMVTILPLASYYSWKVLK
jgi:O-antigen/teichoic acid export membrane protein